MKNSTVSITVSPIGKIHTGETINQYRFANDNGVEVAAINFGGIITSVKVPDKNGKLEDVVLGFDSLEKYLVDRHYLGAVVGRYCNRIAGGKLMINGIQYDLALNNTPNHIHGGINGFSKVVWHGQPIEDAKGKGIKFTYLSKDMEEGYPGNLNVEVVYKLTKDNALEIEYKATTDKTTVVNMTQHSYFNLEGHKNLNVEGHILSMNADGYLPVDQYAIPKGHIEDVAKSPFDFRKATPVGERVNEKHQQLKFGNGYDHCWVLNKDEGKLALAATVQAPLSGRHMEVYTTEPGVQFYSGNYLDESIIGKGGTAYNSRHGLCLETGHYPDSPNQPAFPSTTLAPDETYYSKTVYKFSNT